MSRASILFLTLAILISGKAIASPITDPTKPYVEEIPVVNLQTNLFTDKQDLTTLANACWQVGFIKIYPNNPNKNWAMIEGRRVGVGSTVLGGRVVSLSRKRLELRQGNKRRSLILLDCDSIGDIQSSSDCKSMYYIVSTNKGC
ncbi:MAG: hypothetical protein HQL68_12665 [Magnetococcales bacterium]|nr:hypothetical protein [Magnetococcales bacterium]